MAVNPREREREREIERSIKARPRCRPRRDIFGFARFSPVYTLNFPEARQHPAIQFGWQRANRSGSYSRGGGGGMVEFLK